MAGAVDTLLKLSVVTAVLVASSSVGYYYVVYLPQRDLQIDAQHQLELQRQEDNRRAAEQMREAEQVGARFRYGQCRTRAYNEYEANWGSTCKALLNESIKQHTDCVRQGTMQKTLCDTVYKIREGGSDCKLPTKFAQQLETALEKARDRCLQESRIGIQ
jgi:hypothetical protein